VRNDFMSKTKSKSISEGDKLSDFERRKDFAACAMVEAQTMVDHWVRKRDEAKVLFNACLIQYTLKKHDKVSVAQMVKDGFEVNIKPQPNDH
jgi:hypothetical protein